jgi:hypothetical protein
MKGMEMAKAKVEKAVEAEVIPEVTTDPVKIAAREHANRVSAQLELQAKTIEDNRKKALKKPLTEPEKFRLGQIEIAAQSGKQPNVDDMKDLGLLRQREMITPLSTVEEVELNRLNIAIQAGGISNELNTRLTRLRKRARL